MSAPPKFATLPDAITAYLAGRSRRWAEVDGWQIDLEQAVAEAGRVREEPAASIKLQPLYDRALVAKNIAAELARASDVLPELAVPSEAARDVECCRECGRPMIGEVRATVVVLGDGFGAESSRTRERKAVKP